MPRPDYANSQELPSRDSLIRAYDAASAARARNARLRAQDKMRERAEHADINPREHREPLTSQESHDQAVRSRESYERERASRIARNNSVALRSGPREVIDGRGSIDSRALNETNALVGYTINDKDRHDPVIDSFDSPTRWSSTAGHIHGNAKRGRVRTHRSRTADLSHLSDTISSRSDFPGNRTGPAVPMSIVVLGGLIVVLLIVLLVLLFF